MTTELMNKLRHREQMLYKEAFNFYSQLFAEARGLRTTTPVLNQHDLYERERMLNRDINRVYSFYSTFEGKIMQIEKSFKYDNRNKSENIALYQSELKLIENDAEREFNQIRNNIISL